MDSYGAKLVLGNLWARLASSPLHWFRVDPGTHGENFKFADEVARRSTELQLDREYYVVKNLQPETVMALAKEIMTTANLTSYASNIVQTTGGAHMTVIDTETDFIYLKKVLKVPATELQIKTVSTISGSTREDQLNAGLVFRIEFNDTAPSVDEQH